MSTSDLESLRGSCSCGRNQYFIRIPDDVADHARIYFDDSSDNRRFHGTPLTAWLRVPLDWYQSHTRSYFSDETHRMIRRTFTPHHAPHSQRSFCGFCGTPLTYWTESPRDEGGFMSVTVGSLYGDDQHILEDLDLLPGSSEEEGAEEDEDKSEEENDEKEEEAAAEEQEQETEDVDEEVPARSRGPEPTTSSAVAPSSSSSFVVPTLGTEPLTRSYRHGTMSGIPWFEEMIEGSRLGRLMKGRRGMGVSDDDSTKFQWEVSEWHDDGSGGAMRQMQSSSSSYSHSSYSSPGKRKRGSRGDLEGGSSQQRRTE